MLRELRAEDGDDRHSARPAMLPAQGKGQLYGRRLEGNLSSCSGRGAARRMSPARSLSDAVAKYRRIVSPAA
jgi:hypothetical protein